MKSILKAKGRSIVVPGDVLTTNQLVCKFCGQSGLPQAADSIAYDPVQRLVAVRSSWRLAERLVVQDLKCTTIYQIESPVTPSEVCQMHLIRSLAE